MIANDDWLFMYSLFIIDGPSILFVPFDGNQIIPFFFKDAFPSPPTLFYFPFFWTHLQLQKAWFWGWPQGSRGYVINHF